KNKSQKFKTKGDFIENVFEYDDANKDGKYDTIRKIYFADRNEDGVTDLVHFQLFKNEGVFKKPLMTQAMMIDDDYDGIADRIIADKDGDNNYDSQLFIGIRLDPDGLFFLFF
ncbi:hypothetical protein HY643_04585, partial [Candidatus Woesearchaeota archaeon]|nr:hypothetical protein [Candidatus Woesearchaeota archaeon]